MKGQKSAAAIISIRNGAEYVSPICRKLLEFCSSLLVIVEASEDRTRNQLVKLERELPIIIFDSEPLSEQQRFKKLLELGANAFEFFPFSHFLFLDATTPLSDHTFGRYKQKLREIYSDSDTYNNSDSTTEFIEQSFYKDFLSRKEVLILYKEKFKTVKKVPASKPNIHFFPKILKKVRRLFKKSSEHSSGIFKTSFHSQNLYLDYPPFRYLSDKYSPTSVLDIGCGLGGYVKAYADWGAADVQGVDGFPKSKDVICPDSYRQHDLREPLNLKNRYDLVICVEVAEHIAPEFESNLLNSIERHSTTRILFSAAQIGQPGIGHINCQKIEYWIKKWNELGWEANVYDTLAVRSLSSFLWFRKNLLVFQKTGQTEQEQPGFERYRNELLLKETNIDNWFNQPPTVYHRPLTDGIPGFNFYDEIL